MTFREQSELLMSAIQQLMRLYQDIATRAEAFTPARDSELKKIRRFRQNKAFLSRSSTIWQTVRRSFLPSLSESGTDCGNSKKKPFRVKKRRKQILGEMKMQF